MAKKKIIVITEERGRELVALIEQMVDTKLSALKSKLDKYPDISDTMLKDGVTRAFLNGKFEEIAGAGMDVLADDKITATALVLEAFETGRLPEGHEPEVYEEMRELMGEDIFDEMAALTAATQELLPSVSDEELIAQAKADYLRRKAESELDVEQGKTK